MVHQDAYFNSLYRLYGSAAPVFENGCYHALTKLSSGVYRGGQWSCHELTWDSGTVFWLEPDSPQRFDLTGGQNYFHAERVIPRACGLIVSLIVTNQLAWHYHSESEKGLSGAAELSDLFSGRYHALRRFSFATSDEREAEIIFRAID